MNFTASSTCATVLEYWETLYYCRSLGYGKLETQYKLTNVTSIVMGFTAAVRPLLRHRRQFIVPNLQEFHDYSSLTKFLLWILQPSLQRPFYVTIFRFYNALFVLLSSLLSTYLGEYNDEISRNIVNQSDHADLFSIKYSGIDKLYLPELASKTAVQYLSLTLKPVCESAGFNIQQSYFQWRVTDGSKMDAIWSFRYTR